MAVYTQNALIPTLTLTALSLDVLASQKDHVLLYASSGVNFPTQSNRCDVEFDIIDQNSLEVAIGPKAQTWCTSVFIAQFVTWQLNRLSVQPPATKFTIRANIYNRNASSVSFGLWVVTDIER